MGDGGVVIETSTPIDAATITALQQSLGIRVGDRKDNTVTLLFPGSTDIPDIVAFLAQRGARIVQVRRGEASMEQIYTEIMRQEQPQ